MLPVPACTVCGETERTIVAEYNRLIFLDAVWRSDLARYDYALCHGCGLVHPTRRPDREEYEYLYANFNEFLLREGNPNRMSVPELTPQMAQDIDDQFVPWRELDTVELKGKKIRRRLRADLDTARTYLPHITDHMPLAGAKVLQLRAKSSTLATYLKDAHGAAQVDLVTLFPTYQYLAEKNPDIRVTTSIDYEAFRIPYAEKYDLILETHILVHMVDPGQTFAEFRAHLADGGAIFLKSELADDELCRNGKNLFAELRPFHFNQFDRATLRRMLHRFGFDAVAIESGEGSELIGLARLVGGERPCPRISAGELRARLDMYRAWRDESILSLPRQRAAALFGSELPQVWQRVRAAGRLKPSDLGVPLAHRTVHDVDLPIEDLEIGVIGKRRRWLSGWFADRMRHAGLSKQVAGLLRGTQLATWLASALRGTRAGAWLKYRVIGVERARKQAL